MNDLDWEDNQFTSGYYRIDTDSNWYIIPLCKTHNGEKGKSLIISDNIKLVSANVSETCGK